MDELHSWLILARAPGVHAGVLESLLRRHHSLDEIVSAEAATLGQSKLSPEAIDAIVHPDERRLASDRRWLEGHANHFVSCHSQEFPRLLREISDSPIGLFVRGNIASLSQPQLAMVGSRTPTSGGQAIAESFAAQLVGCGLTVTSGLAVGIDAASHRGAMRAGGATIAVCGTGLDRIYPRAHTKLAEEICEHGALVSEFAPGTPAHKFHFPRRNRIISALSLGTLVVEAALQSGSLITARYAGEQGREVFAVPGSIYNPFVRGCHALLRNGAKLVESVEDILAELGPLAAVPRRAFSGDSSVRAPSTAPGQLDNDYKMLLDALGFDPAGIDQLADRSGLKADAIASMLLILELEGRIESLPGALFARVAGE
jgi:DNA processing protein